MKKLLSVVILSVLVCNAFSQGLTLPPSGDNQKSVVTQYIGPVAVTIKYNSPNVHAPNGDDRTGKIWGTTVAHYGFIDQGFGPAKAAPWRAGSNENTTITFSHDVKIGGKDVKAGTYGLFLDVEKDGPWNWILSSATRSWGSYYYDAKEDVARFETKPVDAAYTEYLTYGFDTRERASAVAYLQWENKRIPFTIEVPNVNEIYYGIVSEELRGNLGFDYRNIQTAAQFCVNNKIHLDQALVWADQAISQPFIGREEFATFQTKANVLRALGRDADAEAVMTKAINHNTATVQSIHQYARTLMAAGKNEKAMEVFKLNRTKFPEDKFTTFVGLARGYTALGDTKNAIKNWEIAIKNLPEDQKQNLSFYEGELKKLKGGV